MKRSAKRFSDPMIATKLIAGLNRLMGLRPFDDSKGQPRILLSSPYLVLLWSLISYAAVFADKLESPQQKLQMYLQSFYTWLYILNSICLTLLGYHYSKMFVLYEKKMLKVDESLRKLGIPTEYGGAVARSMILIIAWFSQMILIFVSLKASIPRLGVPIGLYVNFSCCYVMNIGALVLLDFVICVGSVKDRYEKVNDLLANYATDGLQIQAKKYPSRVLLPEGPLRSNILVRSRSNLTPLECLSRKEEQWEYTEGGNWRLQVIRLVHLELYQASDLLSEIFGVQVALEIRLSVISITIMLYSIYVNMNESRFGMTSMWSNTALAMSCIFDVVKLFLLSRTCEQTSRQGHKALIDVHSCYPSVINTVKRSEIRQFALQLSHCHQQYTKRYFSKLNYSLLTKCVSALTTNLVIMIQMSQSLDPKYSPMMVNNSIANATIGS